LDNSHSDGPSNQPQTLRPIVNRSGHRNKKLTVRRRYIVGFLFLVIIVATIFAVIIPNTQKIICMIQEPQQTRQQGAKGGNALYVSLLGSDSNPGTQTAPFATIEKADSVAVPGTTVHVLPGTYTWNGVSTTHSGTAAAPITFISDIKWGAKLTPASVNSHSRNDVWHTKGDYVYVIGFDIKGPPGVGTLNGIGLEGSYSKIIGNRVHDIDINAACIDGGNGIYIWDYASHDDDILGNVVYNIVSAPADDCWEHHGIYYSQIGGYINNNVVFNVGAGWGIHCWHACSTVIITNNLVFNNRGGIVIGGGDAPNNANSLADNIIIADNIAINNAGGGIHEYEYTGEHTIGTHNQILNNIVYSNAGGNMVLLEKHTASGTITSDAQFVNYQPDGGGDYHLKPTSPAIDAGKAVSTPSTDFDDNLRPQGKGYDIGPYEYSASFVVHQSCFNA
jgi:hypothetical protein